MVSNAIDANYTCRSYTFLPRSMQQVVVVSATVESGLEQVAHKRRATTLAVAVVVHPNWTFR